MFAIPLQRKTNKRSMNTYQVTLKQIAVMSHKIVSHRIYKNEYQKSFIMFLAGAFKSEETEKVLTVYGITDEVAESIMSLMYKSESECKELFPQFHTIEDERKAYQYAVRKALNEIRDATCQLFSSDAYKGLTQEQRNEFNSEENIHAVSEFTINQLKCNK